ncbi:hypothetical protein [Nonomuraea phyllanthi]|uniref:hypothetical protein n=1 Tax=Nonomuraea phyllanthi TaxID=2219224 RepID=UPI001D02DBA0|nr:hypothetical protein [Nonomuraea phyllanthi]
MYEITSAGRRVAVEWLTEMLAVPKQEFAQFPAALSHLLMLAAEDAAGILQQRLDAMDKEIQDLQNRLAGQEVERVSMLEFEYLHAVAQAEAAWLRGVIADLKAGRLSW